MMSNFYFQKPTIKNRLQFQLSFAKSQGAASSEAQRVYSVTCL